MSHLTVSHGPSSYRLEDHTEMSFLVCTGRLAVGSGLQQLLEVVFAQNSVTHMLTAKPSPEQFEDIFLQMLSLMLNAIERE